MKLQRCVHANWLTLVIAIRIFVSTHRSRYETISFKKIRIQCLNKLKQKTNNIFWSLVFMGWFLHIILNICFLSSNVKLYDKRVSKITWDDVYLNHTNIVSTLTMVLAYIYSWQFVKFKFKAHVFNNNTENQI